MVNNHHNNDHCHAKKVREVGPREDEEEEEDAVAAPVPAYPEPLRFGRHHHRIQNDIRANTTTQKTVDDDDDEEEDGIVLIENDENALRQKLLDITRQLGDISRHVQPLQLINDRLWRQVVVNSSLEEKAKSTPKPPTRGRPPIKGPNHRNAKKRRVSS
jgi:hypothetical protein